jgi:hypothetical protein
MQQLGAPGVFVAFPDGERDNARLFQLETDVDGVMSTAAMRLWRAVHDRVAAMGDMTASERRLAVDSVYNLLCLLTCHYADVRDLERMQDEAERAFPGLLGLLGEQESAPVISEEDNYKRGALVCRGTTLWIRHVE